MSFTINYKLSKEIESNSGRLGVLSKKVNNYLMDADKFLRKTDAKVPFWQDAPFIDDLVMGFDKVSNKVGWGICLKGESEEVYLAVNAGKFKKIAASQHVESFVEEYALALEDELSKVEAAIAGGQING